VGFPMNLFMVQEFLGVLLVLALSMAAILVVGVAFILLQEGIRRIVRWAKTGVVPLQDLTSKDAWIDRSHARSPSAEFALPRK
jgi:hypothetical protein